MQCTAVLCFAITVTLLAGGCQSKASSTYCPKLTKQESNGHLISATLLCGNGEEHVITVDKNGVSSLPENNTRITRVTISEIGMIGVYWRLPRGEGKTTLRTNGTILSEEL